jgi:hypothetical protein
MDNELAYYCEQGIISNPGSYTYLFENLSSKIEDLVRIVQGLTIHVFWAERYGLKLPTERSNEVQLRSMQKRLAKTLELDDQQLTKPRSLDKKLVGNCRDFSLLLTALMRYQGIPARARCGFGAYFLPDHFEDHWVTEYWNADRECWVLVDAQLDPFQISQMGIKFNPLDVPRDQFVVAGSAWQMCRSGKADPQSFGIFDMHGLGFIRGNLVRDLAALNKVELLPWDCWGIILDGKLDNDEDLIALDQVAELTSARRPDFKSIRRIYELDERFRMQGELKSYIDGGMVSEKLDEFYIQQ